MLTKPQFFYDSTTKQALGFQNPFYLQKAQQSKPKLYVGDIIIQTNPIVIPDSEETLALAEESPQSQEKDKEKALAITTLTDELRKLKGKALVDNNVSNHLSDPELHQVNVEPITPKLLNKRTAHSAYIKHSQEEAAVLRDLVDHIKANYPLDLLLESACKYTKIIQEMLSKISKTCPSINSFGEQLVAVTPMNKVKSVRFTEPVTSSRNTKIAHTSNLVSNKPMLSSTGVKQSTSASGSQPSGNTKKDKIQQTQSRILKNKVEAHPRKVKSSLKNKDHVVEPKGTALVQHSKLNANSCTYSVINLLRKIQREKFGNQQERCLPILDISRDLLVVSKFPLVIKDSGCSKHMTGDRSQLTNFVNKFLGTVKFGNDHVAKIMGYGDYQIGNVTISRVYYVEGLGHNLFSVGTIFVNSKLESSVSSTTPAIFQSRRPLKPSLVMASSSSIFELRKLLIILARHARARRKPHKPKSKNKPIRKLDLLHMDLEDPNAWSRVSMERRCSKHMTGDRLWLKNFMNKFIGTVRFRNDHFGAIMGYGDYVIGDSMISRVYYVEGLGHNLFSIGQFCDSDLEVAFRKHSCYV
ncbi:hypothetical protein Tco_0373256 [Tanacetum coccineum]